MLADLMPEYGIFKIGAEKKVARNAQGFCF